RVGLPRAVPALPGAGHAPVGWPAEILRRRLALTTGAARLPAPPEGDSMDKVAAAAVDRIGFHQIIDGGGFGPCPSCPPRSSVRGRPRDSRNPAKFRVRPRG